MRPVDMVLGTYLNGQGPGEEQSNCGKPWNGQVEGKKKHRREGESGEEIKNKRPRRMRNQKVKEGETEQKNEAEVEPETAAQVSEVVVEMGQQFVRPIVEKIEFRRWVLRRNTISVEGVGERRGLGEGTGELLLKMGSFERGGLGGKGVILLRLLLLILIVDEDFESGIGSRGRRGWRIGMEIQRKMGVFLGERGRRGGVEIGRDAAAFCSDLYFRFLLMHYISKLPKTKTPKFPQQNIQNEKGCQNSYPSSPLSLSFLTLSLSLSL